jgi:hypothetical protein
VIKQRGVVSSPKIPETRISKRECDFLTSPSLPKAWAGISRLFYDWDFVRGVVFLPLFFSSPFLCTILSFLNLSRAEQGRVEKEFFILILSCADGSYLLACAAAICVGIRMLYVLYVWCVGKSGLRVWDGLI